MGGYRCRVIDGVKKGAWSSEEDELLTRYVKLHGERKWSSLARKAGLKRGGKSCRLRWLNYLRPGLKRGDFSEDEDELIVKLHRLLGNRWALIAGRLPGRTDNQVKNYWNTILVKKLQGQTSDSGLSTAQYQAEEKNALQNFRRRKLEPIPVLMQENFGLIDNSQSSRPSMQNDWDHISMDVFNTNKFYISDLHSLKFDALQENVGDKAFGQLENGYQIDPVLDLELRKIASLLDIENEL